VPAVLRIALPVPLMQIFDYLPPVGTDVRACARGSRVLVPFGRSRRVGVVVDTAAQSELADNQLKPVQAVLDPTPLLTAELMDAVIWTSRYYHHPLGEVLHAALPAGLRNARAAEDAGERGLALKAGQVAGEFKARAGSRTAQLLDLLSRGPLTVARLDELLPGWRSAAASLKRLGLVEPVRLASPESLRRQVAGPALNS